MWKQFWDLFRRVLFLTETTETNKSEIKELRKSFKESSEKTETEIRELWRVNERLAYEIKRLSDKLDHKQEQEAAERKMFRLEIENQLLKANRQLPPKTDDEDNG
jgi:hypothetical protein